MEVFFNSSVNCWYYTMWMKYECGTWWNDTDRGTLKYWQMVMNDIYWPVSLSVGIVICVRENKGICFQFGWNLLDAADLWNMGVYLNHTAADHPRRLYCVNVSWTSNLRYIFIDFRMLTWPSLLCFSMKLCSHICWLCSRSRQSLRIW